jgi:GDPmannose 4,6-dehydratase
VTASRTKRALVLGSNGQDGSFLVEHLLRRGYSVVALSRQRSGRTGAGHAACQPVCQDLRRIGEFSELLAEMRPDLIFHFAAVHGRSGTQYEAVWQDMLAVNVEVVHTCLEYLRNHQPGGVLVYAGSSKIFGPRLPSLITEQSPRSSTCLYTVTKNAALDLIECYRRDHGIKASVLHFFHHESERRGKEFFIPKLVSTLHAALLDRNARVEFDTLQFHSDWGSAREYTDIAVDVAERSPSGDAVVATGRTLLARALAQQLFASHGLDYRTHLIERAGGEPSDRPFQVSTDGLAGLIGRVPTVGILDVCETMLTALRRPEYEEVS